MAFSDEHDVAWSKVFDSMILCAASSRSAVASMMTGALPSPTPRAGLPDM